MFPKARTLIEVVRLKFGKQLFKLILFNLLESIILKFFLFFNIFKALFSIPLQITTSKYIFFSSKANFFYILKLQETIPPKALIGSHASASL